MKRPFRNPVRVSPPMGATDLIAGSVVQGASGPIGGERDATGAVTVPIPKVTPGSPDLSPGARARHKLRCTPISDNTARWDTGAGSPGAEPRSAVGDLTLRSSRFAPRGTAITGRQRPLHPTVRDGALPEGEVVLRATDGTSVAGDGTTDSMPSRDQGMPPYSGGFALGEMEDTVVAKPYKPSEVPWSTGDIGTFVVVQDLDCRTVPDVRRGPVGSSVQQSSARLTLTRDSVVSKGEDTEWI